MFSKVLVANRGEIALRVIATLSRMGIGSVAVYTPPDRFSRHAAEADEALLVPSYLDIDAILSAAEHAGAEAVHPGYGFLAENAAFAREAASRGVTFVGPPAEAIELMGDKINAKRAVAAAGVPVVPGRDEAGLSDEQLVEAALQLGLPVLLKPSAGGGGKGMRRVDDPSRLREEISAARREAHGAFGDSTLLVEKFLNRPRHIEVQVFADIYGHTVSLGERECSLQRRHQKVIEEAPSPLLDELERRSMSASAVGAAKACSYVGAGTVELIVAGDRPEDHYFMEMNTRLQVEHPVTEAVTGWDLVEWQLRVASGEALPEAMGEPRIRGHAVEARIYAEDPARGFLPSSGRLLVVEEPKGARVDSAMQEGAEVGTGYDPMLAKVIAWGEDRRTALARLRAALASTTVLGVTTNVGFLRRLLAHPDVEAGRLDTELVERLAPELAGEPLPPHACAAAAAVTLLGGGGGLAPARFHGAGARRWADPWTAADGWGVGGPAETLLRWRCAGKEVEVTLTGDPLGSFVIQVGGSEAMRAFAQLEGDTLDLELDGRLRRYHWASDGRTLWIGHRGDAWQFLPEEPAAGSAGGAAGSSGPVRSPMPGTVLAVHVTVGEPVTAGQPLVSVEAMKMEHTVTAPAGGTVAAVYVRPGQQVGLDEPLAALEPPG